MTNTQRALIKHRNAVIAPASVKSAVEETVNSDLIITFLMELEQLGYVADNALVEQLFTTSRTQFVNWAKSLLKVLAELKGAHYKYTPMYPNFPRQVASASKIELFVNAMIHYFGDWAGYRFIPRTEIEARPALAVPEKNYIVLTEATLDTAREIFVNLISSRISLNEALTKDLMEIKTLLKELPAVTEIPNKENLATYLNFFNFREDKTQVQTLVQAINNPVDILRIVAAKAGSDAALTGKVTFAPVPRWMRKEILATLDKFTPAQLAEAFRARPQLWKAFFAHIHAGEYKQFNIVQDVIAKLRTGGLKNQFNSAVEKAIAGGDVAEAVRLLSTRPTMFVRRVHELAAKFDTGWQVSFANHAPDASLSALLQALGRFENPRDNYIVTSAGKNGKVAIYGGHTRLTDAQKADVAGLIRLAIKDNLSTLPTLGKVYYAPVEGKRAVPFGLRSSADSNRLLGRGSRLPFDQEATLRFFIHWRDLPNGYRVDIDLSASLLDENFNRIKEIAFYNLSHDEAQHSGDLTSAPDGAAEFVDISIPRLRKNNPKARYIAMSGIVYTGQPFDVIPEVMAGFMVREGDPNVGEIFDARTVDTAFTITSPSRNVIPFLFDVETGEAIWLDINTRVTRPAYIAAQIAGENNVLAHVATKRYISIDELLSFHIDARATEIVETPEEADNVIDANTILFDEILSNWL